VYDCCCGLNEKLYAIASAKHRLAGSRIFIESLKKSCCLCIILIIGLVLKKKGGSKKAYMDTSAAFFLGSLIKALGRFLPQFKFTAYTGNKLGSIYMGCYIECEQGSFSVPPGIIYWYSMNECLKSNIYDAHNGNSRVVSVMI
jgi:hypothetical protein